MTLNDNSVACRDYLEYWNDIWGGMTGTNMVGDKNFRKDKVYLFMNLLSGEWWFLIKRNSMS